MTAATQWPEKQLHISSSLVKVRVCGGLNLPQTKEILYSLSLLGYISPRIPIVEGCSPISKRHLFFHQYNHIPFTSKHELEEIERGGWDEEKRRKNLKEKGGTR